MIPSYWNEAKQYLSQTCPIMAGIIASYPGEGMVGRGDPFYTLLRSIVGQQISVKAADSIWNRLVEKAKPLTPQKLLRVRESTLRSVGLRRKKRSIVKSSHAISASPILRAITFIRWMTTLLLPS